MSEHPISFTSDLMLPILMGWKTQTRRVITPQPKIYPLISRGGFWYGTGEKNKLHYASEEHFRRGVVEDFCPYGKAGDSLWLRHSWYHYVTKKNKKNEQAWDPFTRIIRWKDSPGIVTDCEPDTTANGWKHKPGRFMPWWASIVEIIIKNIRVERVQEISESDADAEGIVTIPRSLTRHGRMNGYGVPGTSPEDASTTRVNAYANLWDTINKERGYGWSTNPLVYVITFSYGDRAIVKEVGDVKVFPNLPRARSRPERNEGGR